METISTNVIGTTNILESLRDLNPNCTAIIITSDKCYDNVEWVWGYKESDALGGKDIYSGSKGAAELIFKSYFHSFFKNNKTSNVRLASVRAGNVIGGGDWADNRIVPDCIRAWIKGDSVEIRSPKATRPWQHVLEPLSGYLTIAQKLFENITYNGESFNFGPNSEYNKTVKELLDDLSKNWKLNQKPSYLSKKTSIFHEAGLLKLNCDKALFHLKWLPTLDYKKLIEFTSDWYYNFYYAKIDMLEFTNKQIKEYEEIASTKNIEWTKNKIIIEGILLNPVKKISHDNGDLFHIIRNYDKGYEGFGEAYISTVKYNEIKAWKKHTKMTANMVVPIGKVKMIVFDERPDSKTNGIFNEYELSLDNYYRLTIPPNLIYGFMGLDETLNMIINVTSIPHDPREQINFKKTI